MLWAGVAQWLVDQDRAEARDGGRIRRDDRRHALVLADRRPTGRYATNLLPGYLLVGFALPFTWIPVSIAALAGVQEREAGLASGLINTAQQVGGAIGVAVASSVSISHFNERARARARRSPQAFTSGSQWAFWVMAGVSVAALVATIVLIRPDDLDPVGEPVSVATYPEVSVADLAHARR